MVTGSEKVYKGIHSDIESYSSFYDNAKRAETQLRSVLKDKNVTDVYVCGLALDVCVGELRFFGP
jgi:nicotinamidase-related amidase